MENNYIALDIGERRVGVAIASEQSKLAQPYGVIERVNFWEEVVKLIQAYPAKILIVGLPRGLDGQETDQTKAVRTFSDEINKRTNLPIHFQDEAVTSKRAEEELNQRGVRYTKGDVDALAATYILTDFLKEV